MPDDELRKYIKSYGDRLATVSFCKTTKVTEAGSRASLIDTIKKRLGKHPAKSRQGAYRKQTRTVDVGWLNMDCGEGHFQQVRYKTGGGKRKLKDVDIDVTIAEIMDRAKSIFFPNGESPKGTLENFSVEMRDFSERVLDNDLTIGQLYDATQVDHLRVYLTTRKLTPSMGMSNEGKSKRRKRTSATISVPPNDELPDKPVAPPSEDLLDTLVVPPNDDLPHKSVVPLINPLPDELVVSTADHPSDTPVGPPNDHLPNKPVVPPNGHLPDKEVSTNDHPSDTSVGPPNDHLPNKPVVPPNGHLPDKVVSTNDHPSDTSVGPPNDHLPDKSVVPPNDDFPDKPVVLPNDDFPDKPVVVVPPSEYLPDIPVVILSGSTTQSTDNWDIIQSAFAYSLQDSLDGDVAFGPFTDTSDLNDTVPFNDEITLPPEDIVPITVHRGQVFEEINKLIDRGDISENTLNLDVTMILPNGVLEKGDDSGGVSRDMFTEYMETFYRKCTTGNHVRVPVLRHDMNKSWAVVAKAIKLAKNNVGFLPVKLAIPFLQYTIGKPTDEVTLIDAFRNYVPEDERDFIDKMASDFERASQTPDYADFAENHEIKTIITSASTWTKTLAEVAHRELIQEAAYVADQWALLKDTFSACDLDKMRDGLAATGKRLMAMIEFEENDKSSPIVKYFKKFVRNLTKEQAAKFCRYCTGADIIITDKIHVKLVESMSDFSRLPIGHTCGNVLELPNTYASYAEMNEELCNLLDSNIWVMDIN